jgi:hypothetical protein
MRFLVKALPFLLTAIILVAQTDLRNATVEGTVRNLKTGEPLADVRVTLVQELPAPALVPTPVASRNATTDADGKFTITAISPGRYLVNATRTLFFRSRRDSGPAALTLAEGQRMTGVQILLSSTSVIAGRVTDDRRDPLRSVRIEALRREFRDGLRIWVAAGQAITDDRGEYRLFNLTPGTYYVRAAQSSMPPLYYPGTPDSQNAVPVSVDAGAEAGAIDIEMRRSPDYSVQLTLGGIPTGSMVNFLLRRKSALANEQQAARAEMLTANTYRIGQIAPGAYDLFVQVSSNPVGVGAQPRVLTNAASIPVNVTNANLDLGTVAIPSTVAVTGRILVPEPLPSPLASERLVLTMRALDLAAPIAATARGNTTPPGIQTDGSFTLPYVAPGRYQLQLTGLPPDTYLISAREGTREVLDTGFTVTGSQSPIELTVGGPGSVGSVIGTVVNALGSPVSSSTVWLVPAPERRGNPAAFRTTTTDQSGNFTIRSVIAGDYRALGWEDLEPGSYFDPEFLKGFETRGAAIKVQRGSQNTVTVRVIATQ